MRTTRFLRAIVCFLPHRLRTHVEWEGGPQAMARKAGVRLRNLRRWMRGLAVPRLENAARIARAIGTSIETLLQITSGGQYIQNGKVPS
jgi:hypothetical protein